MKKRKDGPEVIITEEHKYKIWLDLICEFLHQWDDDVFTMEKPNRSVKDYGLEQFQWRLGKKLDEGCNEFNRWL